MCEQNCVSILLTSFINLIPSPFSLYLISHRSPKYFMSLPILAYTYIHFKKNTSFLCSSLSDGIRNIFFFFFSIHRTLRREVGVVFPISMLVTNPKKQQPQKILLLERCFREKKQKREKAFEKVNHSVCLLNQLCVCAT